MTKPFHSPAHNHLAAVSMGRGEGIYLPNICDVCKKRRSGFDHRRCSKIRQQPSGELIESSVTRKLRVTASDGKAYDTNFYNLDAIISVGYRVNSYQATQFRKWATGVLKEYLIKGFALDDERLKQGGKLFGKDYFDELLERVREIRASERRFYRIKKGIDRMIIMHNNYAHEIQPLPHFVIIQLSTGGKHAGLKLQ